MTVHRQLLALFLVAAAPSAQAADGVPDAGKLVFSRCAACHSTKPGVNGVGPSLAGVVGRRAGALPGFNYSPGLRQFKGTWDAATLGTFLANPSATVSGTKMTFPGLKSPKDRDDVVAYLATLK